MKRFSFLVYIFLTGHFLYIIMYDFMTNLSDRVPVIVSLSILNCNRNNTIKIISIEMKLFGIRIVCILNELGRWLRGLQIIHISPFLGFILPPLPPKKEYEL